MENIKDKVSIDGMIQRNNMISTVNLGDEIGMLHIERGKYYGFDSVGTRIWELLDRPKAINDLIAQLLDEYAVDDETCRTHVLEFVNRLLEEDLIAVCHTGGNN